MPSLALQRWKGECSTTLDEVENAHRRVGGTRRGRRRATQQLNRSYALLLSSQFQAYCRDLHTECSSIISDQVLPISLRAVLNAEFSLHRKLDAGNPNAGHIGSDFNRLGIGLWDVVKARSIRNEARQVLLDDLAIWRNAIAHNDFTKPLAKGWGTTLYYGQVQRYRSACDRLADEFDAAMRNHLLAMLGRAPW